MWSTPVRCWRGSIRRSRLADLGTLVAQVSTLQAQVSRMQAETGEPPVHLYRAGSEHGVAGFDLYGQRQAEFAFKLENYQQKMDSLTATIASAPVPISPTTASRLVYAKTVEQMRKDLERLNVGSKINTLVRDGQPRADAGQPG